MFCAFLRHERNYCLYSVKRLQQQAREIDRENQRVKSWREALVIPPHKQRRHKERNRCGDDFKAGPEDVAAVCSTRRPGGGGGGASNSLHKGTLAPNSFMLEGRCPLYSSSKRYLRLCAQLRSIEERLYRRSITQKNTGTR